MTKKQLLKELEGYPEDIEIKLSADFEGNEYYGEFDVAQVSWSDSVDGPVNIDEVKEYSDARKLLILWPA